MRLMRFPTVHGNEVVFTYASDLWTSTVDGGYARRLTSHPGMEQKAYYSPDGKYIAFTAQYDGNTDVYVMPAEGGEPKRLTFEPDADVCQGWTPDGKVAYLSTYGSFTGRQRRLWLVDPRGSLPLATPVLEAADIWFSPDGQRLAYDRMGSNRFNWRRYRGGSQGVISIFDLRNNSYRELPHGRENSWNPMWIGDSIYFVSDKNLNTINLYRFDVKSGSTTQLTHYSDADIHWPNTDGKTIVFERDGYLYHYSIANATVAKVNPMVKGDLLATRPQLRRLGTQISSMAISPTGVRTVVEARGHIFTVPVRHGETRDLTANSSGSRARFPDWSYDGKTIAYMSDVSGEYQIYTIPQKGGTPTKVTDYSGASMNGLGWSPDNNHIAFTTAGHDLMLVDLNTKKTTKVFTDPYTNVGNFDFSPDGKWIAFIGTGKNQFGALHLYNVDTGKSTQVDEGYYNDDAVAFDLSGRYLYLISDRTYTPRPAPFEDNLFLADTARIYVITLSKDLKNPLEAEADEEPATEGEAKKPKSGPPPAAKTTDAPAAPAVPAIKIDLDGLASRTVALPMPQGPYQAIVGGDACVFYFSAGNVSRFDLHARQSSPVAVGLPGIVTFNPTRSKMGYYSGGTMGVVDVHPGPPISAGEGRVDTGGVEAVIDPRAEWKQIFWEGWRYERDNFYDKDFLGLNWNEIGQRYSRYLPYVAHREDLNYVLGLMIGEFGTSHAYVNGGDTGAPVPSIPIGQLGADYEIVGGKVRLQHVYAGENFDDSRRGPLGAPGVNVQDGEYLLAINGQPVDAFHSPDSYLVDKVGKEVTLTLNATPAIAGARTVIVRPIGSEGDLRYGDWVEYNRRKVAQMSEGRIGYMHVPDTSDPGMTEFLKGYYSQSDKDALVVDERWNGGGHIPTFFTEKLARTYRSYLKARHGDDVGFPVQTVQGPKVMIINGYAGSGGDLFPWLFRQAQLGPLVGERTWGGLVGISGSASLVDGGYLTSPGFGLFDPVAGKWIAENNGIEPDIPVDARPDLVAKGQDPQLEAAVKYLLDKLRKNGPYKIKEPAYPRVEPSNGKGNLTGKGGGGR
jgi:tricorn protease